MILKIQKPLFLSNNENLYLVYNKTKSILLNDIEVGQCLKLDNMFGDDENKIYVEGYLDKKERLIIKHKVEEQDW